jgi:hypothetical protein
MNEPTLVAHIEGIGIWSRDWPDWQTAAAAIRSGAEPAQLPPGKPVRAPAALLAGNERRRASDSVLLALEVGAAAVRASGFDARTLPSIFCSAHGDLAIVDALCRTLASEPALLSPTRFHHSVHNAASGYWSIAAGSLAPSTALAAYDCSFAGGLLEALAQLAHDEEQLLLVACDTEATGALASVNTSRGLLAMGLVLGRARRPASRWRLSATLRATAAPQPALRSPAAAAHARNASADLLPLAEALACGGPFELALPLREHCALELNGEPLLDTVP